MNGRFSNEQFLQFFLRLPGNRKKKHLDLINDLHAVRRPTLQAEVSEILSEIDISLMHGELTQDEAKNLKDEFRKLDFMNISAARIAKRQSDKLARRRNI